MATLQQLETALVNAHNAGDADAARKLAAAIVEARQDPVNQIPGIEVPGATATPAEPSLGEKIVGSGEAALATGTALTGGALGMAGGTIGGLAGSVASGEFGTPEGAKRVEQAAAEGAQALTYTPRTQAGQEKAEAVGHVLQQTIPAVPVLAGIPVTARPAVQAVQRPLTAAQEAVKAKVEAAAARRAAEQGQGATPGTMGSVGAAGTDMATMRRANAEEMGFTGDSAITKGQATRNFEQQRFEKEMAKDPTKGQALRERAANQNAQVWRNFDLWEEQTGAQKATLGEAGDSVKQALLSRYRADKNRERAAFKQAEKAGDMEAPVTLGDAVNYLNENAPDAAVAPVLDAMKARAVRLGVAVPDATTGELVAQPVSLRVAETWRRSINNAMGYDKTNVYHGTGVKRLIDSATEGKGGDLYRQARAISARNHHNYENIGLVYDLMAEKRGTVDARVAAENVFQRSILNSSMADVKQLRRILQTGGEEGQQAWRELQGATIRHIREQASRDRRFNERGQQMVSDSGLTSAIAALDKSGKLDFIFGRRGAEQLRALSDLSKELFTAPPGAVNTSNTASVILAALDIATSGVAGVPLPVMSGLRILTTHVRDRQIQKRINEALGIKPEPKKVKAPQSATPRGPTAGRVPESRTVH